jgi:4'-phosphopantetheinyl transferase
MIECYPWPVGEIPPPPLKGEEAHVWCVRLDPEEQAVTLLAQRLTPEERTRAARIALPVQRRRFTVARGRLREILGEYTGLPPERVPFRYGPWGKPALAEPFTLHFSVSHTEEIAVFAVHRTAALGVDVERVRPIPNCEGIAKRFFTDREHRSLRSVPDDQKSLAFFRCWTRKEACAKAIGGSLIPMLKRIEFAVDTDTPTRPVLVDGDPAAAGRWYVASIAPAKGYLGALASEGRISEVLAWWWPETTP